MTDNLRNDRKITIEEDTKVVLYGLGVYGTRLGKKYLNLLGIDDYYISDINGELANNPMWKGLKYVAPDEIRRSEQHWMIMLFAGQNVEKSVREYFVSKTNIDIVSIYEIVTYDEIVEDFYGNSLDGNGFVQYKAVDRHTSIIQPSKIAIYVNITGGYDRFDLPDTYSDNCDYYLISDSRPEILGRFTWIPTSEVVPSEIQSHPDRNRYCKMHGSRIFDSYRYSIYLDGKVHLKQNIDKYVNDIGRLGIAMQKSYLWDCAYIEAITVAASGGIDENVVKEQMLSYYDAGFPRNFGAFECSIIARDHSNQKANVIFNQWWDEYSRGVRRDQLSFPYILWRNGYNKNDIGIIGDGKMWLDNPDFTWHTFHRHL